MPGYWTTVRISRKTRERLAKHGSYGQTLTEIIDGLLDEVEKRGDKK